MKFLMDNYFNIPSRSIFSHSITTVAIDPFTAVMLGLGGAAAIHSMTRGRGGGRGATPPMPQLDPRGKEFQQELYPTITRGLRGGGLTPELTGRSIRELLAATTRGYQEAHKETSSLTARTIPRADLKVREFISNALNAEFARQKEGIREEFETQPFEDISRAQGLAFGALGGEKRIGASITGAYNQSMLRRAYQPTFASAMAGGLGGAAGMMLAGPIGYGREFSRFG